MSQTRDIPSLSKFYPPDEVTLLRKVRHLTRASQAQRSLTLVAHSQALAKI